jgi:acetyl-CoA C-acetyltransferase
MRDVSVIGVGQTKFGEHWNDSLRDLVTDAGVAALTDAKIEGKDVQAVFGGCMAAGRFIGQEHIGALLADQMGMNPLPSVRVEAACASGGVALRMGYMAVASGMYDVVAVAGVEKMTDVSTEDAAVALAGAGDQEWELFNGATFPAIYALMARRHMIDYGTTQEQMAFCSVKNHAHAVSNPFAQFRKEITVEQVMNSGAIASPLKLLDCSPLTDGAAALVLCAKDVAKKFTDKPVDITASVQTSDTLALHERRTLTGLWATQVAAKQAYQAAGISPKDVDVLECHDCFSIAQIMALEDLGFCEKGTGGKFVEEGRIDKDGEIPTNLSGGLKAVGHPVGASGVREAIDVVRQLRGDAPKPVQLNDAQIGLSHNVGGSGATVVVHAFKRGF